MVKTISSIFIVFFILPHTVFAEDWKSTNVITGPVTTEDPIEPAHNFNIQYRILNGTGTFQVVHDYTFTANIHSKTSGIFELMIPRNFPYFNGKNGPSNVEKYIITENGVNITRSEYIKTSDCFFTYYVPFYGNSTIEILSMDTLLLVTPIYGDKVPSHCLLETMMIPENHVRDKVISSKVPEFPFCNFNIVS